MIGSETERSSVRVNGSRNFLLAAALLLTLNLVVASWVLGTLGALLFLVGAVLALCRMECFGRGLWDRLLFGFLLLFGVATVGLDGMYLLFGRFETWMVGVVLWLLVGMLLLFPRQSRIVSAGAHSHAHLVPSVSRQACCCCSCFLARTDIPLVSPWNLFDLSRFFCSACHLCRHVFRARAR